MEIPRIWEDAIHDGYSDLPVEAQRESFYCGNLTMT